MGKDLWIGCLCCLLSKGAGALACRDLVFVMWRSQTPCFRAAPSGFFSINSKLMIRDPSTQSHCLWRQSSDWFCTTGLIQGGRMQWLRWEEDLLPPHGTLLRHPPGTLLIHLPGGGWRVCNMQNPGPVGTCTPCSSTCWDLSPRESRKCCVLGNLPLKTKKWFFFNSYF